MSELDRTRLVQLLGMLGSHESGERANAASFAHRMVSDAGLTWKEVLGESNTDALRHEIERYRQDLGRMERALEAAHRQVLDLASELERTRAFVENERSTWREQRKAPRETAPTGPRSKPSNWGSDLFEDEPAAVRLLFFLAVVICVIIAFVLLAGSQDK